MGSLSRNVLVLWVGGGGGWAGVEGGGRAGGVRGCL